MISLGCSCKVRQAIQRCAGIHGETNVFDWVLSNFNGVLRLIRHIDEPLVEDDFNDTNTTYPGLNGRIVTHVIGRFDSIHDMVIDKPYETQICTFLDMCNRRLTRLKATILSDAKLHFILLADCNMPNENIYIPSLEEIITFNKLINNINPNCAYCLHILIPPHQCKVYKNIFKYDKTEVEKLSSDNVFVYFLTQDETLDPFKEECRHWSWSDVFENINKLDRKE